ncbi:MAG TPA: antibiotic biosynthesis monooxygenase [Bdellovibrio sp.]|uniref:putative quinol monooxygenase n=1 Tax=Bdellovibrio sp. TaxID=28201 RepID=UPI002EF5846C
MVGPALLVTMEAKPGKENEVEEFLKQAASLVHDEDATTVWFAVKFGPRTFGIFDAFPNEKGREAHLAGKVAERLMAKAPDLFERTPRIEKIDVLAEKIPGSERIDYDIPPEAYAP